MNRSIYNPYQFGLRSIIGVATFVALVSIRNSLWATIFTIEMIAVYLFVAGLVRNLPFAFIDGFHQNCLRHDGSLDPARLSIERRELRTLFWHVLAVFVMLFVAPVNLVVFYYQSQPFAPGATSLAISLVWLFCSPLLFRAVYINLLQRAQGRAGDRSEIYWAADITSLNASPLDD